MGGSFSRGSQIFSKNLKDGRMATASLQREKFGKDAMKSWEAENSMAPNSNRRLNSEDSYGTGPEKFRPKRVVFMEEQNKSAASALHSAAQIPEMTPELLKFLNERGPVHKSAFVDKFASGREMPHTKTDIQDDRPLPTNRSKVIRGPEKVPRGYVPEDKIESILSCNEKVASDKFGIDVDKLSILRKYVRVPQLKKSNNDEFYASWDQQYKESKSD